MSAGASADAESFGRTLVYLARHGQTALNEADVLRGLADPPLNETGRRQAERLGAALGPRAWKWPSIIACSTGITGRGQVSAARR